MLGSTDATAEPKSPHHADNGGGDAGDGRLSALPDELLHAILSRLKAKQTVQTCALATRWRHLWRSVPRLDIDRRYKRKGFNHFTTNLLRGHEFELLEEFRLHGISGPVGNRWLRHCGQDAWPRRLRKLHLSSLALELNDLASHISSPRCPALEDVQLEICALLLTTNARIVSSSLKRLAIIDAEYTVEDLEPFKLTIDAPALVSLRLAGGEFDHILDKTQQHAMPSLIDASIHLPCIYKTVQEQLNILLALSNVTTLHLSHFNVTLIFFMSHEHLPVFKFENLRTLILEKCSINDDFLGLRQYLHNSPNLQKLTLRNCKVSDFHPTKKAMKHRQSYSKDLVDFKCNDLRLCEIIYRDADASGGLLVEFFAGIRRNLPNNKIEFTPLKRKKHDRTHLIVD